MLIPQLYKDASSFLDVVAYKLDNTKAENSVAVFRATVQPLHLFPTGVVCEIP